jgi:hypothetical protein
VRGTEFVRACAARVCGPINARARACVRIVHVCARYHRFRCIVLAAGRLFATRTKARAAVLRRWLEGLCTVLNRIVDAHEKRGAPHTPTAVWLQSESDGAV